MHNRLITLVLLLVSCAFSQAQAELSSEEWSKLELAVSDDPVAVIEKLKATPPSDAVANQALRYLLISEAYYLLARGVEGMQAVQAGIETLRAETQGQLYRRLLLSKALNMDVLGQSQQALNLIEQIELELSVRERPTLGREAQFARAIALTSLSKLPDALEILVGLYTDASVQTARANKGDIANAIGNVYLGHNDIPNALRFYQESFELTQDKQRMKRNVVAFNIASCYSALGDNVQAKRYLNISLNLAQTLRDDQGIAYIADALANIEIEDGNYKQAEINAELAVAQFAKVGDKIMQINALISAARSKNELRQSGAAHELLNNAEALLADVEIKFQKQDIYLLRTEVYADEGRFSEAYENHIKFHDEALHNIKTNDRNRVEELRIKFDSERKEQENKLLLKEKLLQETKLEQQTQQNYLISIVILLLLTWVLFLVYSARKNQQIRAKLDALAYTDELTNAANRRQIVEATEKERERAKRYRHHCTVALVDIDHFKKINDRFGHNAGDEVLKEFAKLCNNNLRSTDCFGRYGGEEFLILLPETELNDAIVLLERLRELTENYSFSALPSGINVTISLGVTEVNDADNNISELLKRADEALYEAKFRGRNVLALKERKHFQFIKPVADEEVRRFEML